MSQGAAFERLRETIGPAAKARWSSPVETIWAECSNCSVSFHDWFRPSVNLTLPGWNPADPFVHQYLRGCSSATCPACGKVHDLDIFILDHDALRIGTIR
jgi:hypothetical protein